MTVRKNMPTVDGKTYRIARKLAELHFKRKKWYGYCTKEERTNWLVNNYWDGWIDDAKILIEEFRKID